MNRPTIVFFILGILASIQSYAQPSLGGYTGLIMTPTAYLHEDGTLLLGAGYTPSTYAVIDPDQAGELSYYANLTFLPFLEIVLGATLPDDFIGIRGIGDRKGIIRVQVLKEGENNWRPSILIGLHDPFNSARAVYGGGGNQNFNTNYLVLSKKLKFKKYWSTDFHLGYGVSWQEVLNKHLIGLFGGVSFNYKDMVMTMIEYDTEKINCGIKLKLFNSLYLTGALLDMKALTGGINFKIFLGYASSVENVANF